MTIPQRWISSREFAFKELHKEFSTPKEFTAVELLRMGLIEQRKNPDTEEIEYRVTDLGFESLRLKRA